MRLPVVLSCVVLACFLARPAAADDADTNARKVCNASEEMDLCEADAAIITHKATFANLQAGDYTGKVKETYEVAYGIAIKIYDVAAKQYRFGSSVTSSVTTRRSVSVKFVGSAHHSMAATAQSAAKAITPASLVENIKAANTATGNNVAVPTAAQVAVVDSTKYPPPDDDDDGMKTWVIIVIIVIAAVVAIGAILGIYMVMNKGGEAPATDKPADDNLFVDNEANKMGEIGVQLDETPKTLAEGAPASAGRACC